MFKNLHVKIFALLLAVLFWIIVASLENNFYQMPQDVQIRVFNQAPELALSSKLETVKLTVRSQDVALLRRLLPDDFEAYVDLRNVGAGDRVLPVSVTSKNPQVNVVRVDPSEVKVALEPMRQKYVALALAVSGKPAVGFKVGSVKLSADSVIVKGASSALAKIASAKAEVVLNGAEKEDVVKAVKVKIYGRAGAEIEELQIESTDIAASVAIVAEEGSKQVEIKAKLTGTLANGTVKTIEVLPAMVFISGSSEALAAIETVETEPIELAGASESFSKKAKLLLPAGVRLQEGQPQEAEVKVVIEKMPVPAVEE